MILITGATGLIGNFLAKELLAQGHRVRALCRTPQAGLQGLSWVQTDILDMAGLERALEGVTHVFHCAGLVSFAPRDSRLLYQVNTQGTANVVNACLNKPGIRLIHVSSVAAIGKIQGNGSPAENDRWEAQQGHSVYAASKHWAEAEVWRGIAEGLQAVIVNPSIVLGGADFTRSSTRLFRYVWEERPFFIDGEANFVDVRDVVEVMIRLGFSGITAERFILNAGTLSYSAFFNLAAACLHKKAPYIKINPGVARAIAWAEHLRSLATGARPLITPDTVRRTKDRVVYQSAKVEKALNFRFRPLAETVAWACAQVKARQGQKTGTEEVG